MSSWVAIGVGCRLGCSAEAIESLVRQALDQIPNTGRPRLFTVLDKVNEPGLVEVAQRFRFDLIPLPRATLQMQTARIRTRSDRAEQIFGVGSIAEAAALAGAGENSVLIVSRIANQVATCAVAASPR